MKLNSKLLIMRKYRNDYFIKNGKMIQICGKIRVYSRIWSTYLNACFPTLIGCCSYLIYVLFVNTSVATVDKAIYYFCCIGFFGDLFAITQVCSVIVRNNRKVVGENRKFYINLRKFDKDRTLFYQLKAESMQIAGQFSPYSFNLMANYAINSQTFYWV